MLVRIGPVFLVLQVCSSVDTFTSVSEMGSSGSGSGSGYIRRRRQSMAINTTEQGERKNCFYIRPPLLLCLPCLSKSRWVVTTIMFKNQAKNSSAIGIV